VPKTRTDPVVSADGDERHPAFGVIGISRIHATPGEVLFASDVQHPEYIRVQVHEASRKRRLKRDWVHPGPLVCEVSMSLAQFASFVASGGTGNVPCTIEYAGSGEHEPGHRPGLLPASRLALTTGEARAAAQSAFRDIEQAFRNYEQALADKKPAAERRSALGWLRAAILNAVPNVAYATRALDEHAEDVVEKSRADIEAMVAQAAQRLSISPGEVPAIEGNVAGGTGLDGKGPR
jgi:hypothetical protein